MKDQSNRIYLFVLLFTILLVGCTNYQQDYIDNGNTILKENQLDGEIHMIYKEKYSGYDVYKMSVLSEKFADISDDQKKVILEKLDNISILDAKWLVMPEIDSQGHTYSLNYDGVLEQDGEVYPPEPTSVLFIMPKGDFQLSWDTFNSEYNSLGGILTIIRQGYKYTMELVMPDGSSSRSDLTVLSDGEEIRLTDRPGNSFGDYMYISSTGYLYFCDNQGVIYTAPLLK